MTDEHTLGLVEIEATIGETVSRHTLDLDPNRLTLRETVRLERVLGPELGGLRDASDGGGEVIVTMALVQAMIWTKLCSVLPEPIGIDDFDIELGAVTPHTTEAAVPNGGSNGAEPIIDADELEAHLFAGGPEPGRAAVPKA